MPDSRPVSHDSISSTLVSQIRLLKSKPATVARRREISRLERILARARKLEELGETILSAVVPVTAPRTKRRDTKRGKAPAGSRKPSQRK